MARPLLPARVRKNMAKPPNHPVSRTLGKNQRFAEIVRKTCREEQGPEVFHAHLWQKRASVFAAKVCGNMCDPWQCFPATPSRHAGDVQRRRQARNPLQPFYCRELATYKLKGLSGLNGRQTFVAIVANLADKAQQVG